MTQEDKSLALVACYYNPCDYEKRRDNFFKFYEGMAGFYDQLIIVELAFDDQPFALDALPNVIQLRSESVMWQKEALLNIGIRDAVDKKFKYVAWLDADIKFKNPDWYENILKALESNKLVQVFKNIKRFENDDQFRLTKGTIASIGRASPACGFGWACPTSHFMNGFDLYDKGIVGGGDTLIYAAAVEKMSSWFSKRPTTVPHGFDIVDWSNKWYVLNSARKYGRSVGSLGYAKNNIDTFYHGSLKNRSYLTRHELLLKNHYDPEKDLVKREDGVWDWSDSASNKLKIDIRDYFISRQEDG